MMTETLITEARHDLTHYLLYVVVAVVYSWAQSQIYLDGRTYLRATITALFVLSSQLLADKLSWRLEVGDMQESSTLQPSAYWRYTKTDKYAY